MNKNKIMTLRLRDDDVPTSIIVEKSVADALDDLLKFLNNSGLKISRNAFIVEAIKYYVNHLLTSKNYTKIFNKMKGEKK